ncbi:hypothetical protein PFICI_14092 [Pestalotiopsis fici W106-1]|uniref:Uncharacterized protein n=1 Tax=Pestalotiopsis fici (strain W106-1 / CGMCC3.15140) TaxID=1229662 RepID=W3WN53_PESFW|nr:uncharacterized protein PFICI_14092 [Pestalotiopsis fici W106-1]ETS74226.1 hypothetical protein PFICI_14092 [Pestalotiopsis fici W106-1]
MPLFGKPRITPPTPASGGLLLAKNHTLPQQKPLIWLGEGSLPDISLVQIVKECWRYNLDSSTGLIEPLASSRQRISLKSMHDTTQLLFSSLDQLFFYGSLTRHPLPISPPHHRLFPNHKRSRPLIILDARSSNANSTISYYDHVTRTIHFRAQRGGIQRTDLLNLLVHEMIHAYIQVFAAQPASSMSAAKEMEIFIVESISPRLTRRLKTKRRQKFPPVIEGGAGVAAAATSSASGRERTGRAWIVGTAEGCQSDEPSMWTSETLRAIEAYWDTI